MSGPITTRIATSRADVVSAWRLVHDQFVRRGLIEPAASGMVEPKRAHPDGICVALSLLNGSPFATVTGVVDRVGLPADDVFGHELAALQSCGARIMEACLTASVAVSVKSWTDKLGLLWWFADAMDCTHIVFTAHPREVAVYCHAIGFVPFGPTKVYPGRNNAPAALGVLSMEEIVRCADRPRAIDSFLASPIPSSAFDSRYRFEDWEQ